MLTAPDGAANDRFGRALDVSSTAVAIGAYQDDDNGLDAGSAYVFPIVNETLLDPVKLQASGSGGTSVIDAFGCSIDLEGTLLTIAAPGGSIIEAYLYTDIGALDGDGDGIPDECEDLPGDINGDGHVDGQDLLACSARWGNCPGLPAPCPADLTGDGVIDNADLELFYVYWLG